MHVCFKEDECKNRLGGASLATIENEESEKIPYQLIEISALGINITQEDRQQSSFGEL